MPFDRIDLLQQAGFEAGDYAPLAYSSGVGTGTDTTTAGGYVVAANNGQGVIRWDTIAPSAGTMVVWFLARVVQLNGTTLDVRVRNTTDNETMVERTGIASTGPVEISPTAYTPTTTADAILFRTQLRSGDGASTVEINSGSPTIGVEL
jgi:hypothetical protein